MKPSNDVKWICNDCALEAGRKIIEGILPTWHMDTCDVCKKHRWVTEPRDFDFPDTKRFG